MGDTMKPTMSAHQENSGLTRLLIWRHAHGFLLLVVTNAMRISPVLYHRHATPLLPKQAQPSGSIKRMVLPFISFPLGQLVVGRVGLL
jgi:hypothetical protein